MIIISRFILNLRRFNHAKGTTTGSLSYLRFQEPSRKGFVGEMGRPLDHGFDDFDSEAPNADLGSDISTIALPQELTTNTEPLSRVTLVNSTGR